MIVDLGGPRCGSCRLLCALVARCVNSTPCVHVVVAPPSLPSLSHRRSERPPCVLIMRSGSPGCVWVLCTPRDPALGGHASLVSPWVTLVPVFGCVCVCLLGSLVCPGRCPLSCLRRTLRRRPSNSLVPWLAQVSKACVALFAACLPLRCWPSVGVLARKSLFPPTPPPCRVLSHVRYVHTLERTGNGLS